MRTGRPSINVCDNPLFKVDGEYLMTLTEMVEQNPKVGDVAHLTNSDFSVISGLALGGGVYVNNVWISRVR